MSLFARKVDPKLWLPQFSAVHDEAAPLIARIAQFFGDSDPSPAQADELAACSRQLDALLPRAKALGKPADSRLRKLHGHFNQLVYAAARFAEWTVKHAEEPSAVRAASKTMFMVAAVEHFKAFREIRGTS